MNQTKIDTDGIRNAVKDLKNLNEEYKNREKKPAYKKGAGKTYDALERAVELMNQEWDTLFELVENSIVFLNDTAASYDINDHNAAKSLK